MDNCGVYSISFYTDSGFRVYIGSSVNISKRHQRHLHDLKLGIHSNQYLQRLWNKYRYLDVELFEECDRDNVRSREQFWLDVLGGCASLINSNPCATGGGHLNPSIESRTRYAASSTGRNHTEETKQKLSNARKNLSESGRKNLSESMRGRVYSEETCQRMSKAKIGTHRSDETKAKISNTLKGTHRPDDVKLKISKAQKGIPRSPQEWITRRANAKAKEEAQNVITK